MNVRIGCILLYCAMGAALLSGCTITVSPTTTAASPDSTVQSEPETEETPSSSEQVIPETTIPSQVTRSPEDQSEKQSAENAELTFAELKEICQNGYTFFKECQIGQEGILTFDLSNQLMVGEQQYIALASINSKEDFLTYCTELFSDSFIDQNISPWLEGENARFLEDQGHLYYKAPSGTGLVTPLATSNAEVEQQAANEVSIAFPLWNPQTQETLSGSVSVVLLRDNETWKINEIKEDIN